MAGRPFVAFPIQVVGSLERALRAIGKRKRSTITIDPGMRDELLVPFDDGSVGHIPGTRWKIELDGIACAYRLIGDDILQYEAIGNLEERHVDSLFALHEKAIVESGLARGGHFNIIADWSRLGQGNLKARKLFIERFSESFRKYPCESCIVYGLSRLLQAVVALMRQFLPVTLVVAENLEDALDFIAVQRASGTASSGSDEGKVQAPLRGHVAHQEGL